MKIAITADVHLVSQKKNPERYRALTNILDQIVTQKIDTLVIAGDLFDASCKDPGVLEEAVKKPKYENIRIFIIPGNHDPVLSKGAFTLSNIEYITKPSLVELFKDIPFLFLPYEPNTSIGETLATCQFQLKQNAWVLIAHGDNLASTRLRNNYEDGFYMPLSGRDLQIYQPQKVFLGHIHAPYDSSIVHYPGSPCGLDISETGIRSFLTYDSAKGKVERIFIETDVIYIQESITVLPTDDEEEYVTKMLVDKIACWNLNSEQKRKVRVRINLQGYSTNRERILKVIEDLLTRNELKADEKPDLSKVKLSNDVMRADIAAEVQKRIVELNLPESQDEPTNDEYILAAMSQIYKG